MEAVTKEEGPDRTYLGEARDDVKFLVTKDRTHQVGAGGILGCFGGHHLGTLGGEHRRVHGHQPVGERHPQLIGFGEAAILLPHTLAVIQKQYDASWPLAFELGKQHGAKQEKQQQPQQHHAQAGHEQPARPTHRALFMTVEKKHANRHRHDHKDRQPQGHQAAKA